MAAVGVARGSSFIFSKQLLIDMEPLTLLAVRSVLAFAVLMMLFGKRVVSAVMEEPRNIRAGAVIGIAYFLVMIFELYGLKYTTSATASLIEHSAIVWVPLAEAVLRRRAPGWITMTCCLLSLTGLAFVASGGYGQGIGLGEFLCILAAFSYTAAIILTDTQSKKYDAFVIGILYIGFMGAFAAVGSLVIEDTHLPQAPEQWVMLMMLVLICSCFGFTMQPVAQKFLSAETSGLFTAINPLTASVLGTLVLNEPFGLYKWIGAILIIGGILLHSLTALNQE